MKTPLERVQPNIYFTFFKGVQRVELCIANRGDTLPHTVCLVNLGTRGAPAGRTLFTGFHVFPEQGLIFSCLVVRELRELVLARLWQGPTWYPIQIAELTFEASGNKPSICSNHVKSRVWGNCEQTTVRILQNQNIRMKISKDELHPPYAICCSDESQGRCDPHSSGL